MSIPVLFYFWSERSQHCLQLTPVLDKLAAEYAGQFVLAKVDCDAEQMIASQFGLRSIPTVYLFKDGQPVDGFQARSPKRSATCCSVSCRRKKPETGAGAGTAGRRQRRRSAAAAERRLAEQPTAQRHRPDAGRNPDRAQPQRRRRSGTGDHPVAGSRYPLSGLVAQIELLKQAADTPKSNSCNSRYSSSRTTSSWQCSWRCSCIRSGVTKKRWNC